MEQRPTPPSPRTTPTLRSRLLCGLAWLAATMAAWVVVVAATGLAGAASHPSYWRRVITFGAVVGLAAFLNGFALGPERSRRQLYEENPFRWRHVLVLLVIVLLGRYLLRMMD